MVQNLSAYRASSTNRISMMKSTIKTPISISKNRDSSGPCKLTVASRPQNRIPAAILSGPAPLANEKPNARMKLARKRARRDSICATYTNFTLVFTNKITAIYAALTTESCVAVPDGTAYGQSPTSPQLTVRRPMESRSAAKWLCASTTIR